MSESDSWHSLKCEFDFGTGIVRASKFHGGWVILGFWWMMGIKRASP